MDFRRLSVDLADEGAGTMMGKEVLRTSAAMKVESIVVEPLLALLDGATWANAVRTIAERADAAGLAAGLLVARSRDGRGGIPAGRGER